VRDLNRKLLVIAIALMAVAMLATSLIGLAMAAKPEQISGEWRFTGPMPPIYSDQKQAGANVFATQYNTGEYDVGPILGTFEQYIYMKLHFGNPKLDFEYLSTINPSLWPPYDYNWHIERTFTGTVNGKTGTFTMNLEAKGSWTGSPSPGSLIGTWVIISGTGELANLHGQGTWTNLNPQRLSYEGKINFSP
jgi:hypothetical protein